MRDQLASQSFDSVQNTESGYQLTQAEISLFGKKYNENTSSGEEEV